MRYSKLTNNVYLMLFLAKKTPDELKLRKLSRETQRRVNVNASSLQIIKII